MKPTHKQEHKIVVIRSDDDDIHALVVADLLIYPPNPYADNPDDYMGYTDITDVEVVDTLRYTEEGERVDVEITPVIEEQAIEEAGW